MNRGSFLSSTSPGTLRIQRLREARAKRRGRPVLHTAAERDHLLRSKWAQQGAERRKLQKPVYVPIKPPIIHQVIRSWPAPVLGSLAYGMAHAPRGGAV